MLGTCPLSLYLADRLSVSLRYYHKIKWTFPVKISKKLDFYSLHQIYYAIVSQTLSFNVLPVITDDGGPMHPCRWCRHFICVEQHALYSGYVCALGPEAPSTLSSRPFLFL